MSVVNPEQAAAAIQELPEKFLDPANYPKIQPDLRLLKSALGECQDHCVNGVNLNKITAVQIG